MSATQQMFAGKSVLMTGTTGFVGKCLLEKMLRDVPDLHKVFILIRPKKNVQPQQRAVAEISTSPIFNRLRSEIDNFEEYFQSKVVAMAGDITQDDMGLGPADLARVHAEVHYIMNCAANVDFNERIDGAMTTNCRGPMRMLAIANRCTNLLAYVHVSTAYVNCNRPNKSLIPEELPQCAADGEQVLAEITQLSPPQLEARSAELLQKEGYPNTYTFTKAMGEKLLCKHHGRIPVGIVRPSIIGAAWKEPEPGWVDTVSAGGALFLAGGLGLMQVQAGKASLVGDQIPVDLVVNTIIAAAAEVARRGEGFFKIYQSGSSTVNPVRWTATAKAVKKYWRQRPSTKSDVPVGYRMVNNPVWYQVVHMTQVTLPSMAFSVYARLSSSASIKRRAATMKKVLSRTRVLSETFYHFVNNEWFFANDNTKAMEQRMTPQDKELFMCSPDIVDWEIYFDDFQWGLQRWVLKEDVVPSQHRKDALQLARLKGSKGGWLFSDVAFALNYAHKRAGAGANASSDEVIRAVLGSKVVQEAAQQAGPGGADKAAALVQEMAAALSGPSVRLMAWLLAKVNRRLFTKLLVDTSGFETLKKLPPSAPVVLLPTHKSYLDFLLVSWVLFVFDARLPHIAAGDNFLNVALVASLFRWSGAFFIPRSVAGGSLMSAVLSEYTRQLLHRNQWVEFFLEGSRSRTGRIVPPKTGLLGMVVDAWKAKPELDMYVVPVSISYDKCPESSAHVQELLGGAKKKESMSALVSTAPRALRRSFGAAQLLLGAPIALSAAALHASKEGAGEGEALSTSSGAGMVKWLAEKVVQDQLRQQAVSPSALVASVLLAKRGGAGAEQVAVTGKQITEEVSLLRKAVAGWGGHVLDGGMIGQDVRGGVMLLQDFVSVAGMGKGGKVRDDTTVTWASGSAVEAMSLHYFAAPLLPFAARDASLFLSLLRLSPSAPHSAPLAQVMAGAAVVRGWLDSEVLYSRPADPTTDCQKTVQRLRREGLLAVEGEGPEAKLTLLPSGLSRCHHVVSLFRPLVEAHWALAAQVGLVVGGGEGGKGGEKGEREKREVTAAAALNSAALAAKGVVLYAEAASTASITNALTWLTASGALNERKAEGEVGKGGPERVRWLSVANPETLAQCQALLASLRPPGSPSPAPSALAALLAAPRPKL